MIKRVITNLFMICLMLSFISPVYAVKMDGVEITGTYSEQFKLETSSGSLFELPIMNPGDIWENKVNIKNDTESPMEIKLSEVVSDIEDTDIFDVLEAEIYINDKLFFEGLYKDIPASEWITIEPGDEIAIDVVLKFPGTCGNEYQGKEFDSTWKFESRLPEGAKPPVDAEPDKDTTVKDETVPDSGRESNFHLFIGLAAISGVCLLLLIIPFKKNDKEEKRNRSRR